MDFFVDTWGWLVLAGPREPAHLAVRGFYARRRQAGGRPVTTDHVLAETATILFKRARFAAASSFFASILSDAHAGRLALEFVGSDRFEEAWRFRQRYADKPRLSFVDLTSFVVMRERRIQEVITGDADFETVGLGFARVPGDEAG